MKKGNKNKPLVFVVCILIVFIVAALGSLFTKDSVNSPWYESIKPSITPPNYVFPIVWTILFFLIALSLYFAWIKGKNRKVAAEVFAINLIFNLAWSILYFGLRNVFYAFIDLIFLWFSIILIMKVTWKIDRKTTYLLIPYLIWVTFAGILNFLSIKIV